MSIRDDLRAFSESHLNLVHLVYGDLSTGMVLFAVAADDRGQESHEGFLAAATHALTLAEGIAADGAAGDRLVVSDPATTALILRDSTAEEVLVLRLASLAGFAGVSNDAAALLARLTGEGG